MSLTYTAQQSSSRKSGAIIIVALLHLGFFYAFTHGLDVVKLVAPIKDTVAVFIPEDKPPTPEPPKPDIKPQETPIDMMVPQVPVPVETVPAEVPVSLETGATLTTEVGTETGGTGSEVAPARSFSIKHRVDPAYPAAARRAGQTGTVLLNVVVGPDGKPADVSVELSSGFGALDEAAVTAVRKWRFTVNGTSDYARVRVPVTFKLETSG